MKKCLCRLENDSIANKMEKSRKGNGLDGKRRGPAIQCVEQPAPRGVSFTWNCHSLEMEEWVSGEGPGLRLSCVVVLKPLGLRGGPGVACTGGAQGPGARATLTSSRWERGGWEKQERRMVGWTLEVRK